jgi:HPt (histidine-containing phosphotransfer) domain-containing protein
MDGHLAKPIDRESLLAAVTRLASGGAAVATPGDAEEPPLVAGAALATLTADLGTTAGVVIAEFISELRLGIDSLGDPALQRDPTRLRQAAHRLLGAARTLGARRLARAIETVQAQIHAGAPTDDALRTLLRVAELTLPALDAALQPKAVNDSTPPEQARLAAQGMAE